MKDAREPHEDVHLLGQMLIKLGPEEELIRSVMEVMVRICVDERDFTQAVVEIISDLREEGEGEGEEEEEEEKEGDGKVKETERVHRLLKSLEMARCMFEHMRGSLQQSTSVPGLLQELVLPAAVHPHLEVREVAVTCLGLACYLDKVRERRRGRGYERERERGKSSSWHESRDWRHNGWNYSFMWFGMVTWSYRQWH